MKNLLLHGRKCLVCVINNKKGEYYSLYRCWFSAALLKFSFFLVFLWLSFQLLYIIRGARSRLFFKDLSQRHILTTLEACSISAGFADFQISPCLRPVSSIVFHEISHFPRDSLLMGFGGTLLPRGSLWQSVRKVPQSRRISPHHGSF